MKYPIKYNKVFDKDDNIVDIVFVNKNNRLPEYYSIGSHTPMIAALGKSNQNHFKAKRGYRFDPETELHKYVKRILEYRFNTEDHFYIKYYRKEYCPNERQCIFFDEKNNRCGILQEKLCEYDLKEYYDNATQEGSYDGYDADVLLSSSSHQRRPVFLEVAVTHPCTEEKIASGNKIIELFVTCEDDAYCELEQTAPYDYHKRVKIMFHNFDDKIKIQGCPHFVREKKYAQQPYTLITVALPTKFYCIPPKITEDPLKAYFDNTQIGMLFASNSYAKPFVFDKAISLDKKYLIIMGKDIYGAIKPWVVYAITWKDNNFYYSVYAHFDYESALKNFTIFQGKTWHGGDTMSDQC